MRAMEREEDIFMQDSRPLGKPCQRLLSSDGSEVAEVWAHGPVVRYPYGGPHPSGRNRHERRAAAAKARR